MHVMIDLETLSTRPDARIAQVGAVAFEARSGGRILNGKAFNAYIRLPGAEGGSGPTGHIDPDTLAWWEQQDPEAQKRLHDGMEAGRIECAVLDHFEHWPEQVLDTNWSGIEGVWAHGATFDLPVLHSAYARHNRDVPWNFQAGRDTRTLFWLVGGAPQVDTVGFMKHDAVDDCVMQIMAVQQALGMLGR